MKKCLTILLCLCMVWTMTPLGAWAEPVVDNEAGTITVTTLEEMIAALNDAEGPDTVQVEQTINISKEEDGFRTVVIPAGKTLWLENADCLQFQFARCNVRVEGGGGKLAVHDNARDEDITLFSGASDDDAVFQIEEGWAMWCPNMGANDPDNPDKYTQSGEDKWIYITGNMWFEPGRVTVQGEIPYYFAQSIIVDSGITMTVKEEKTFRPSMFAEIRGTLVIPEGSTYDIYHTQGGEQIERRPWMTIDSNLDCKGALEDYGCEVFLQNAGEDFVDPNEIRTDGKTLAIDPGTKNGFSLESIDLGTSWTDRQEAVSAIVPQWDPEWVLVDHGGSQLKTGAYTFPDPRCPLTVTLHWRYDGGTEDTRSAELQVNTDWDAEHPLEEGEDYTVYWYEKDGEGPVATGSFVYGLDPGKEYEVEALLSMDAAQGFQQLPRKKVSLDDSHNIVSVYIPLLEKQNVSGTVTDPEGNPIKDVSVTLRQINGQYTRQDTAETDENGVFSFGGVPGIKSTLIFTIKGFFEERVSVENWEEYEGDLSAMEVEMTPLTTDRIKVDSLTIRYSRTMLASYSMSFGGGSYSSEEEVPVTESLKEFPDHLEISVYKKGEDGNPDVPLVSQAEFPYIYLRESGQAAEGDTLQIRVHDTRGLWADCTEEVRLDEYRTGSLNLTIPEKGRLIFQYEKRPDFEVTAMLFDESGKRVPVKEDTTVVYSAQGGLFIGTHMNSLNNIEEGTYTVVLAEKTDLLWTVPDLFRLEEMGLESGKDYIQKTVTIRNGSPTTLKVDRIPKMSPHSWSGKEAQFSFTAGTKQVPVGNFVTLRASYDLGDSNNAEKISFDIPEGLDLAAGSVTVDGRAHPYTYAENVLTVLTDQPKAAVRFSVVPAQAGEPVVNAYLKAGEEFMPMGSVALESSMAEIFAPSRTGRQEITVSGTAPYGCGVTVYDNGEAAGTAVAMASGRWSTKVTLSEAETAASHRIDASFEYDGKTYRTGAATVVYDPNCREVSKVTMINAVHSMNPQKPMEYTSVFDFLNDGPMPVYDYWPELPTFTFRAEFTKDCEDLEDVRVITTDASGSETSVELSYDSASDAWIGTHDYETGYDIPAALRVEYTDPKDQIGSYSNEDEYLSDISAFAEELSRGAKDILFEDYSMSDFYAIEGGFGADVFNEEGEPVAVCRILQEVSTPEEFESEYSTYETGSCGEKAFYKAVDTDGSALKIVYLIEKEDNQYIKITRSLEGTGREAAGEESGTVYGALSGVLYAAAGETVRATVPEAAADNAFRAANQPGATLQDVSAALGHDLDEALVNTGANLQEKYGNIIDRDVALVDFCLTGDGLSGFVASAMNEPKGPMIYAAWDLAGAAVDLGLTAYVTEEWDNALGDVITLGKAFIPGKIGSALSFIDIIKSENTAEGIYHGIMMAVPPQYSIPVGLAGAWFEISSKALSRFLDKWGHSTRNKKASGNQDPSGYVYEAVPSNRLEGVTATIYYKGEDGAEVEWPQEIADQYNPQTTDANGVFSWMVPQGSWKVKFSKEGYEDTDSTEVAAKIAADLPGYTAGWLPVPPPQTEVNVPMVSTKAPDVANVNAYEDGVRVEFTQYMQPDTVKVTVTMNGEEVEGTLEPVNAEKDAAGENTYASVFRFIPAEGTKLEGGVGVDVSKESANYTGRKMPEDYSVDDVPVAIEPTGITTPKDLVVKPGTEQRITLALTPAGAGAGKELNVISSSPSVLEVVSGPVIVDESGKAVITVKGNLPGNAVLLVTMDGTELDAQIKVKIGEEEGGDDPDDPPGGGGGGSGGESDDPGTDPPEEDHDAVCPSKAFSDLDTSLWYHEGTDYVIENGIMNGTGDGIFEPNANMTRAMIVTILHRMEGEPGAPDSDFTDLTQDWYKAAVSWAAEKGIVNGYSAEKFGPNDPVTREQLAAILYRYEKRDGASSSELQALSPYKDSDQISDWAVDAMAWCVAAGLINGMSETTLGPKGTSTRAQVATIIMRLKTGG